MICYSGKTRESKGIPGRFKTVGWERRKRWPPRSLQRLNLSFLSPPQDRPATTIDIRLPPPVLHNLRFSSKTPTELGEEIEHQRNRRLFVATCFISKIQTWRSCAEALYSGFILRSPRFPPPNSETSLLLQHSSILRLQEDSLGSLSQRALRGFL